jgi:hypothetical protein
VTRRCQSASGGGMVVLARRWGARAPHPLSRVRAPSHRRARCRTARGGGVGCSGVGCPRLESARGCGMLQCSSIATAP